MIYQYTKIESKDRDSLKTEVRFIIASASVDQVELLAIELPQIEEEVESKRLRAALARMLSSLKREGRITFYVIAETLSHSSTEAEFLVNKYGEHIAAIESTERVFLVKL